MLVICAGMCRSGSTWQYQVACDLLERTGPGERLGFLTPPEFDRVMAEPPAGRWRVFKTHDGHPTFGSALATENARCLYSYRDLRDVAYSLAHKWSVPLRTAVIDRVGVRNCIANHAFWTTQPHVFVQRYEDWVNDPAADVTRTANHLGVELQPGEAESIARRFSFEENRRRTEELATHLRTDGVDLNDPQNTLLSDPSTLLHWNHIRAGRVGGWRAQATPEDLTLLIQECGSWLAEHGYEDHPAWSALGQAAQREEAQAAALAALRAEMEAHRTSAERHARELEMRLERSEALLASEREANQALHSAMDHLRDQFEETCLTLNGAWSCLPHRFMRWARARLARR